MQSYLTTSPPRPGMIERHCERCGRVFYTHPCHVRRGRARFCCKEHYWESLSEPAEIRFWRHVQKTPSCWLWTGFVPENGYARIGLGHGRSILAHRFSWELHHGAVPQGLQVLHDCPGGDTRHCINPAHLFLGTQADNVRDASRKGRLLTGDRHRAAHVHATLTRGPLNAMNLYPESRPKGEKNGWSKLKAADVLEMRRQRAAGVPLKELAEQFHVRKTTVCGICLGRAWKHLL